MQALATGVLYALAQPAFSLWPLAFVCLVPLALAIAERPLPERVALGAIAGGAAGWATSLEPAAVGLAHFFDRSLAFGLACAALATASVGGAAFALAAALAGRGSRRFAWLAPWRFGIAFAAGEWARSHLATGLPWLLLAHALAPAPAAAQLASSIGVAGLGLLLAVANGVVAVLVSGPARRIAIGSALLLLGAFWWGEAVAPPFERGAAGSIVLAQEHAAVPANALRVALVQPATPLVWAGDAARVRERLDRLVTLSQRSPTADLVIWPESAIEAPLPANEALVRAAVARLDPQPALLFGAPRYDRAAPGRIYNSAVLWAADGRAQGAHDKVRLLPFTEFVPAGLAALGVRGGHTAAGARIAPLALGSDRIGVLICYELLFSDLAQQLVAAGAGILVNPSNDDWFGATAGGEQMLAAGVLRAIETRRPLLRVTPSGVTAAIDARGRVVARLATGRADVLVVDVVPGRAGSEAARR